MPFHSIDLGEYFSHTNLLLLLQSRNDCSNLLYRPIPHEVYFHAAFINVPLSTVSTMTVFPTASVVFARNPLIILDAPQPEYAHTFDLSSSAERISPEGLAMKFSSMNAFALGPRSTWCQCVGILMTVLHSSSIKNTSVFHEGLITSLLTSPVYPASRLDITCSRSTAL
jgi:hypothetical protein